MAGDPYYNNVSLLLHCNGADNSTTFTDSSPAPKTVTTVGNAKVSTIQNKFGGTSAYFDGTGDFLRLPITTDLQFGSDNFTIEAWVYPTTSGTVRALAMGQGDLATAGGSSYSFMIGSATCDLYIGTNASSVTAPNPSANAWSHVALVRNGTSLKSYLNGTQVGSTTLSTGATVNTGATTHPFTIGAYNSGGSAFTGYIDELRVTKGVARYTSAFTPATEEFTGLVSISGTISETFTASTFIARAYDMETGVLVGTTLFTGTSSFTINLSAAATACIVTVSADYKPWKASTVYALNDKVFPLDPIAKPYYYKRIVAGTSGTVEPTWAVTPAGQCNDGAVTNAWELVERLIQPVTQGPLIPI